MASIVSPDFVSVVTPFYNTANYLRECIDSVLNQTHGNFEYILLDNASDDGSSEIAKEYSAVDSRIRLIRNDSLLPQVPNYNRALACISAESRYCKLVQADDWIFPECLERMIAVASTDPRIGLVSSLRLDGKTVKGDGLPYDQAKVPGREAGRAQLFGRAFVFGSPTTVLYRSDIVRNRLPFFEENRFQEDTEVCFEIMKDWDLGYVHQLLSYTRAEPDSMFSRLSRYDNSILGKVIIAHRYGPNFLNPDEFDVLWRRTLGAYYRQLAAAMIEFRGGKDYRRFHKTELSQEGLAIDPKRLAWGLILEILDIIGNPKKSLGRIIHWIRTG